MSDVSLIVPERVDFSEWNLGQDITLNDIKSECINTIIINEFLDCLQCDGHLYSDRVKPLDIRARLMTEEYNHTTTPYFDVDVESSIRDEVDHYLSEREPSDKLSLEKTRDKLLEMAKLITDEVLQS